MTRNQRRELDWGIPALCRSLALLAAPSQEQISYIHRYRVHPDELALAFDDARTVLPQLEAGEYVTPDQAHAVAALDRQLQAMSGASNRRLWTDEALGSAPEWDTVRALAGAALALFAEAGQIEQLERELWRAEQEIVRGRELVAEFWAKANDPQLSSRDRALNRALALARSGLIDALEARLPEQEEQLRRLKAEQ